MPQINAKTGVILAAGMGSRIRGPESSSLVKPLTYVCGEPLLIRTIHSLCLAGCQNIIIVLGYQAESIKKYIHTNYQGPIELKLVLNPQYKQQNGVSVLCARPYIANEFILTMADHILDDGIMRLVDKHSPLPNGASLCVDYKLDTIFNMDDATKVLVEGRSIKNIRKDLDEFNCVDTGVFVGTEGLMSAISHVYKQKGDASLSEGVQVLADSGLMEAIDIKDGFWQDVDTPEMLKHAEKLLKKHDKG